MNLLVLILAICAPNPGNPENDCDVDGCKVGEGDCNDNLDGGVLQRGPGCPNGARAESCDGIDNNCSGTPDEGNPGGGGSCSTGQPGVCGPGTSQCTSGSLVCQRNVNPSAEICDGLDNDCDGPVDNRAGQGANTLTRTCYAGAAGSFTGTCPPTGNNIGNCTPTGQCAGATQTCTGGNFPACTSGTPGQTFPATETCNNLDDDCDGTRDDGNPGGGGSCSTGQSGVCAAGTFQCSGGGLVCQRTVNPSAEICDGLDNDCDGVIDEGASGTPSSLTRTCYAGASGSYTGTCPPTGNTVGNCTPRGQCAGVTQTCTGGAFAACTAGTGSQTFPVAETCNSLDDDCDGMPDDGNPGGGGGCSTGQSGVCGPGTTQCTGGSLVCQRNVNPSAEICDGLDNDCDNVIDEGASGAPSSLTRTCYAGPMGSYTGTCPPAGNAIGNCTPRGICAGVTQTCTAGSFATCNASVPGQTFPTTEVCNGLDDNCDGTRDNNVSGAGMACTVMGGVGRCANGSTVCQADGGLGCQGLNPIAEQCNGIDDDCDSVTDEGPSGAAGSLTRVCYAGPAGTFSGTCPPAGTAVVGNCTPRAPCGGAVQACGGAAGFPVCNASVPNQTLPGAETCDGIDNDCNGMVDNGDPGGGGMCTAAAQGICAFGTLHCVSGAIACTPGQPQTELCNTTDENCNGQPNDIAPRRCFSGPNVTPVTYTGACPGSTCNPKGACTAGVQLCDLSGNFTSCTLADGGAITTPANPPGEAETTCNGIDDDCDGVVDDGDFDRDLDGIKVCAGDCNDNPDGGAKQLPGNLEICDGVDNNCDGFVDGVNTPCYTGPLGTVKSDGGVGQCRAGMGPCANGMPPPASMCVGQVLPGTEGNVCDQIDNDCDGKVDEDFDLDGDGIPSCVLCPLITPCDCNDNPDGGSFVKPGAVEICDCVDNNCNNTVDEGQVCLNAPCHDIDGDGVTNCQGDCNDNNRLISPLRSEVRANNADDDCDGQIDEDTDEDGDKLTVGQGDCDDKNAAVNPAAQEVCDGFDNNCDGKIDEGFDKDGDNITVCAGDCDDNDVTRSPVKIEICGNAKDDDCNGLTDETLDEDGDGVMACQRLVDCTGQVDCKSDCNDHNAAVHPAFMSVAVAAEVCDGQDNDCNGIPDDGFDKDNDGVPVCFGDCDDNDATRSPLLYELPTPMGGMPKDENCNGQIDESAQDRDGDGFNGFCGDCNDNDKATHPHGTEVCDRVDNNCDGLVDTLPGQVNLCAACFDADNDQQTNCEGDCDDSDPTVFRGAPEICDGKLNNCGVSLGPDLDENGFKVCRDGGFEPDSGTGGGSGGGSAGSGGGAGASGGGNGQNNPVVTTGCGCGETGFSSLGWLALIAVGLCLRRSARRKTNPFISTLRQSSGQASLGVHGEGNRFISFEKAEEKSSPGAANRRWPQIPKQDTFRSSREQSREVGFETITVGLALAFLNVGCSSALTHPEILKADSGQNVSDGGMDAGYRPPVTSWDCGDLYPSEVIPVTVPDSKNPFAVSPKYTQTEIAAADAVLFDDGPNDVAGFVLRRDIPSDVDLSMLEASLGAVSVREVNALDVLGGTPLVRDRNERTTRVFLGPTYTTSQNLIFESTTTAFAVRNRMVSHFSQLPLAKLGALPQVGGALAKDQMVVNVMFRINAPHLFISGAVSPLSKLKSNQPAMLDLTNGSALGDEAGKLQYRCEHRMAPPLKTDFIFVVDNSGSMTEEQAALVKASAALYDAFKSAGLDFRLGVITTDSEVLRGGGFTKDLAQFQSDVRVGIDGNGTEMGLEYALRAIRLAKQPTQAPERKIRDDAGLVVVILSDEENTGLQAVAQYAKDFLAEKAVIFSIVGPKPLGCSRVGLGMAAAGAQYIDASVATGGSSGSICNPNLLEIVEEVLVGSLGASSKSSLVNRPISASLAVRTDKTLERSRSSGFDYDPGGNTILFFGTVPPEGAAFDAAYTYFLTIQ